jgi:hypothetical protein
MYTPGHDTARYLNRQVTCPCCNGKGHYEASHSSNGFDLDGARLYPCTAGCHHGKWNWRDYKANGMFDQFGPARFV